MQDILVLGAGKIGALICGLLAGSGDYRVQPTDKAEGLADEVAAAHGLDTIQAHTFDAADGKSLMAHVKKHKPVAVISGLPFYCNVAVAEIARKENLHYFDLTEDVEVTKAVRRHAAGAGTAFVPRCGLAPGYISIAANELIQHIDELRSVKLRVGEYYAHGGSSQLSAELVARGETGHQRNP